VSSPPKIAPPFLGQMRTGIPRRVTIGWGLVRGIACISVSWPNAARRLPVGQNPPKPSPSCSLTPRALMVAVRSGLGLFERGLATEASLNSEQAGLQPLVTLPLDFRFADALRSDLAGGRRDVHLPKTPGDV
jgi:hypothetical protein